MRLEKQSAPPPAGPTTPRASPDDAPLTDEERVLRCIACGHPIARERDRIAVNGAHEHVVVNPSAVEFRIGCFRDAPGCAGVGDWSTFWTWFAHHAWRIEVCAACFVHLGWAYRAPSGASFHGLLLDKIA